MKSILCEKLDIQFPLFAFSHCRNVVTEVSKAGGFGVLGAVGHTPESLKIELDWIEANIDGKPYGIDLLIPSKMDHKGENAMTTEDLIKLIGHQPQLVVVELNGIIVNPRNWSITKIKEADCLEIVTIVGGGS